MLKRLTIFLCPILTNSTEYEDSVQKNLTMMTTDNDTSIWRMRYEEKVILVLIDCLMFYVLSAVVQPYNNRLIMMYQLLFEWIIWVTFLVISVIPLVISPC